MSNASVTTSRRTLLASGGSVLAAAACASGPLTLEGDARALAQDNLAGASGPQRSRITTADGTSLYYKDWGKGEVVIFSHGWPLSADSWDSQMIYLAERGYRCIAHDRRGHGRSTQPSHGNDMDTYAADLASLIDGLGLRDVTLVGFSTGGGEVARYVGRYGTRRVAKVALISAVTPLMLQTPDNPDGTPIAVFDQLRAQSLADRSKLYRDLASGPFFGFNRAGVAPSQSLIDAFWLQGMQSGHKSAYDCIKAFSETDLSEDLRKIDVPTLIVHGDDDQIVPFAASAGRSSKLVRGATLKVYGGAPHGLPETHKQRLNEDLLSFLQQW